MSCMCGDLQCPSCGPAQGNYRCPACNTWADTGCDCTEEEISSAVKLEAEREYEEFMRDDAPIDDGFYPSREDL